MIVHIACRVHNVWWVVFRPYHGSIASIWRIWILEIRRLSTIRNRRPSVSRICRFSYAYKWCCFQYIDGLLLEDVLRYSWISGKFLIVLKSNKKFIILKMKRYMLKCKSNKFNVYYRPGTQMTHVLQKGWPY